MMIIGKYIVTGEAYLDLVKNFDWNTVTILYQNSKSLRRLKSLFDHTGTVAFGQVCK